MILETKRPSSLLSVGWLDELKQSRNGNSAFGFNAGVLKFSALMVHPDGIYLRFEYDEYDHSGPYKDWTQFEQWYFENVA